MPYLRATIKESLRKAPLGIGILKRAQKDMVLSGYQIPKNVRQKQENQHYCYEEYSYHYVFRLILYYLI